MAKKIKFQLDMGCDVQVGTIEELRENFDSERVLGYFLEGKLLTWLKDRYYEEEAEQIELLSNSDSELKEQFCVLCGILDVDYDEEEDLDIEQVKSRIQKLGKLKQYTDDEEILKNVDSVAFNQEDLAYLYDAYKKTIYLCEGKFVIPRSRQKLNYITVGNATVTRIENNEEDDEELSENYMTSFFSSARMRHPRLFSNRMGYAKKVKFPLDMGNGVQARTIEELRENFDSERVFGYFLEGKLLTWLKDRYYEEEAEQIDLLSDSEGELKERFCMLCSILGVDYNEENLNIEEIETRIQKMDKLKQYTDDEEILKNVDNVAFNQEDLADLYDEHKNTIYLCAGEFAIPKSKQELNYIIVGNATVTGLKKKK